ncbi:SRPBCC family protein [Chloroflexi bacterium TSY]|nr:SRPBCC family protein [Chloroflexi bacterium TSY]
MRYQLELDIDLPRERIIELFLDTQNLAKWQPDLVSFEPLGGDKPREVGAKSRQVHKMGRREVEMIETITVHNYPDQFSATYEADGVWNLIENRFVDIGVGKTKWILDSEFRCSGFMKIMAFFMPGMFKKQTFTFMKRFKDFAENSGG